MGRGIVVLLSMSALGVIEHEGRTSVIHCEAATSHFTGMTPDSIPVGIYRAPVVSDISSFGCIERTLHHELTVSKFLVSQALQALTVQHTP